MAFCEAWNEFETQRTRPGKGVSRSAGPEVANGRVETRWLLGVRLFYVIKVRRARVVATRRRRRGTFGV